MADLFSLAVQGINLILLIALLVVYGSNYRRLKMKYTVGLIFFVALFLVETVMALTFNATMVMYYSAEAAFNAMILEVIKAVGFALLLWVSLE